MPEFVIQAERLGKKYRVQHRKGARYVALRDVLTQKAKSLMSVFRAAESAPLEEEEFWALKDVSFDISQGEVVGIIGRNGAGKSTLLKVLSRITEPSAGKITIRGRIASLLEVGTGFHPELTGRENIFLNGAILGMSGAEIRKSFDEIVDFAEVEKFLDTPVKHYSSGMYVRLAFAVAAHLQPEILIVDEVLAVGDIEFQRKCLGKMGSIATSGRTVIFVSHQLDTIQRLCSKTMVLKAGQISFAGKTDEALSIYRNQTNNDLSFETNIDQTKRHLIKKIQLDPEQLKLGNFHLRVTFAATFPLKSPCLGVVFYDAKGQPLFGSNTIVHPMRQQAPETSQGQFQFILNDLPLNSGLYHLSLWLNDGLENLEMLPSCFSFSFQDPIPPNFPIAPDVVGSAKISPEWFLLQDAAPIA